MEADPPIETASPAPVISMVLHHATRDSHDTMVPRKLIRALGGLSTSADRFQHCVDALSAFVTVDSGLSLVRTGDPVSAFRLSA